MSYLLKLLRIALIKFLKMTNAGTDVEKRELSHTVSVDVNCAATIENSMKVPQKSTNRTVIWSSNSTPGYISKPPQKHQLEKNAYAPVFTAALFIIATIQKQLKCPSIDEWIKTWYMHNIEYVQL